MTSRARMWAGAFVVAAFGVAAFGGAGATAGATTVDFAYQGDWCRFGSWATCAASGECLTPSQVTDNGWTLDDSKLQPKSNTTATGYPLEFICPLVRVFKNGVSSTKTPPLNVQVAFGAVAGKNTDCTLYSLSKYGVVKQSVNFQVAGSGGFTQAVKTLKLTDTNADGSFSLSCKLPNTYPDGAAGLIYNYRSEETSTSTDTKWRNYPASRCAATGSNVATKLRLTYNKATNVDAATREITCPSQDIVGVDTGTSTKYTATIYVNEAAAKGGSKCRLVARDHYNTSLELAATPWIKTTAAGDATLPLAYLPAKLIDYAPRYSVDCQLTAGSSMYSYTVGY
jgi:hypothetical protein